MPPQLGLWRAGETKIGISYEKLATSVKPGNIIKMADGGLSIEAGSCAAGRPPS
jgi:pyruvate kinase